MILQLLWQMCGGLLRSSVLALTLLFHLLEPSPVSAAEKALQLDLPRDMQVAHWQDSHGGFHGDGCAFGEFFTQWPGSFEPQGWQELPLSKDAEAVFYGSASEADGVSVTRGSALPEGVSIPVVEHGRWLLIDRQAGQSGPVWDGSRASCNFTAALWDSDNEVLYFLELDT